MKRLIIASALALFAATASYAADFFSTSRCDRFLEFGARIGVNTTNRTLGDKAFPDCYHNESWGTGFEAGVVATLNVRDYFAVQPGFFFESRSGRYTIMGTGADSMLDVDDSAVSQAGKRRSYDFTIPVMALFRFNLSDDIRWHVEAGPYVSFTLSSKLSNKKIIIDGPAEYPLFGQKAATVDFGFKMGTALQLFDHYYVGVHYMAGVLDAWKDLDIGSVSKNFGGVNKAWVFTVGYDF